MIHFDVKRAKRGRLKRNQWQIHVKGGNNESLLVSETMSNHDDAASTIRTVIESIQNGTYTIDTEPVDR